MWEITIESKEDVDDPRSVIVCRQMRACRWTRPQGVYSCRLRLLRGGSRRQRARRRNSMVATGLNPDRHTAAVKASLAMASSIASTTDVASKIMKLTMKVHFRPDNWKIGSVQQTSKISIS